jgi:hypothetical protein
MVTIPRRRGGFGALVALGVVLQTTACNFDVTNPGPVQDSFLNDPVAFEAIVNGMGRDLADGLNYLAFHGSMVTRELFPTGGTGQYGISPKNGDGLLDEEEQGAPWNLTQRARWTAEDGLRRMTGELGDAANSSRLMAQAHLWAAYANRALGENMCEAVIDGGPIEDREVFLQKAEEHFGHAISVGTAAGASASTIVTAATAGRASVRVHLGDWAGAVTDSKAVPTEFEYKMPYFNLGIDGEFNRIGWAGFGQPYKTHTVWGTVYEDYYRDWNDPRVEWLDTGLNGDGFVACCGVVPFYRQQKMPLRESPITLSSGAEMRLVEAEDQLVKGNWQAAMGIINQLRADYGVAPWTAADATEAWSGLKRERGIQLWLEARRLGDMRRWQVAGTPGALDPKEVVGDESYLLSQDLCFPIPRGERDTNPNIG